MDKYRAIIHTMWPSEIETAIRDAAFRHDVSVTIDVERHWIDMSVVRFRATGETEGLKRLRRDAQRAERNVLGASRIEEVDVPAGDPEGVKTTFNGLTHTSHVVKGRFLI